MIERFGSKSEVRGAVSEARREGRRVGFVPTMGALHEGHLSLVRAACTRTDFVVVSLFVNPTQFNDPADFSAYPRTIDVDLQLLAAEGVEIAFVPTTEAMYGADPQVTVDPGRLGEQWEGAFRPGHFAGVATVVTKLLNIVRPDLAFFGEKDFQQVQVIRKLVEDLDEGTGIVAIPTVRDTDGLALSSRNARLSAEDRAAALAIPAALAAAEESVAWGERSAEAIEQVMRETLETRGGKSVAVDYAAVVDPDTLDRLVLLERPARAIIAARVGETRLIDNAGLVLPVEAGGDVTSDDAGVAVQ